MAKGAEFFYSFSHSYFYFHSHSHSHYPLLLRPPLLLVLLLLLLQPVSVTCALAAASPCAGGQQSLPAATEVHRADVELHIQYPDWHAGDFVRTTADTESSAAPRLETNRSGAVFYGPSFGTARACHLQAIEVHVPPLHTFQADLVSLDVREVSMEVQFHHTCESLQYFRDEVGAIQADLDRLAEEEKSSLHALEVLTRKANNAAADGEAALRAALQDVKDMKAHIVSLRANASQDQKMMKKDKEDMQYERSYHRLHLSKTAVVSLLLHIDEDSPDDRLLDFLSCAWAAHGHCTGGSATFKDPRLWLSALSQSAYHYKGTLGLGQAPCSQHQHQQQDQSPSQSQSQNQSHADSDSGAEAEADAVDWFVLEHRGPVSGKALFQLRTETSGKTRNSNTNTNTSSSSSNNNNDSRQRGSPSLAEHTNTNTNANTNANTDTNVNTNVNINVNINIKLNSSELEVVGVVGSLLEEPKFSLEEKSSRATLFGCAIASLLLVAAFVHAAALFPNDEVPALVCLLALPLVIIVVCHFCGVIRYPAPAPSTDCDYDYDCGYGFWGAWHSVATHAADSWWRVLVTCVHVGVLVLAVILFLDDEKPAAIFLAFVVVTEVLVLSVATLAKDFWIPQFYFSTLVSVDLLVFLLAVGSMLLALVCLFYVLGFSLSTPSLLAPPALLGLYLLLAKVPAVVFAFSAFEATFPLAAFLVKLAWFGIPVTVVMLLAPWFVLPYAAWTSGSVTCTDGFDWEVHLTFALVLVYLSLLWGTLRQTRLNAESVLGRLLTFVFYALALLDMYTDAVFIAIAFGCGSKLGWFALLFYLMGVLVLQLLGPAVTLCCSESSLWGRLLALWTLLLFPAELLGGQQKGRHYQPLQPESVDELDAVDPMRVRFTIMVQAILRLAAEDLPQCVLQYLFTVYVKRNSLIVFSICISIASSTFAVGKAIYRYCG